MASVSGASATVQASQTVGSSRSNGPEAFPRRPETTSFAAQLAARGADRGQAQRPRFGRGAVDGDGPLAGVTSWLGKPLGAPGASASAVSPRDAGRASDADRGDDGGVDGDHVSAGGSAGSGPGAGDASLDHLAPLDALDPMARILRSQIPQGAAAQASPTNGQDLVDQVARVSLDQLMSRLVRRIAWSGDGQAGSARIEFGAGALEGATLTLHARAGDLQVSLDLPPGVDSEMWRARIAERLAARGLQVSSLEVG